MIRTSETIDELAKACAAAQAELENVGKDAINPHFKAKYATLAAVLAEVRPKYAKHGVTIWQAPVNGEGSNIGILTRFAHSSGQWIESEVFVAPSKFDAQGVGSVCSYLRRYSLMAMAGVGTDDDDGNAAVARPERREHANGHSHAPAPLPTPQRPQEPPADPETGEVSPHKIALQHASTGLPNWLDFGQKMTAAYGACNSIGEIAEWEAANIDTLNEMAALARPMHKRVCERRDQARARVTPEMLGAEETGDVLAS